MGTWEFTGTITTGFDIDNFKVTTLQLSDNLDNASMEIVSVETFDMPSAGESYLLTNNGGTLAAGTYSYTVSGTPSDVGNAALSIKFDGSNCLPATIQDTILIVAPPEDQALVATGPANGAADVSGIAVSADEFGAGITLLQESSILNISVSIPPISLSIVNTSQVLPVDATLVVPYTALRVKLARRSDEASDPFNVSSHYSQFEYDNTWRGKGTVLGPIRAGNPNNSGLFEVNGKNIRHYQHPVPGTTFAWDGTTYDIASWCSTNATDFTGAGDAFEGCAGMIIYFQANHTYPRATRLVIGYTCNQGEPEESYYRYFQRWNYKGGANDGGTFGDYPVDISTDTGTVVSPGGPWNGDLHLFGATSLSPSPLTGFDPDDPDVFSIPGLEIRYTYFYAFIRYPTMTSNLNMQFGLWTDRVTPGTLALDPDYVNTDSPNRTAMLHRPIGVYSGSV